VITIYVIYLPKNYSTGIMAFATLEKAREVCEVLQKGHPISASGGHIFEPYLLNVYEDCDVEIKKI
jgi:hypothetical protein